MTACMGLPLLRALCLAGARVMKHVAAPRLGALLQQDVGLIRKTAIIPPHAPRPCLPVWPCLGHAWPRVLPVTTLHGDGLLGRAARRFVKNKKKRPKMVCTSYLRSSFGVKTPEALFGARSTEAWDRRVYRSRTLAPILGKVTTGTRKRGGKIEWCARRRSFFSPFVLFWTTKGMLFAKRTSIKKRFKRLF